MDGCLLLAGCETGGGHGTSTKSEFAIHMLPLLSGEITIGRRSGPLRSLVRVAVTVPSGAMMVTVLLNEPVTQALPVRSMARPKGLTFRDGWLGSGGRGMLKASSGLPFGMSVTESLPQFASQML